MSIKSQFEDGKPRMALYKKLYKEERKKGFDSAKCTWRIGKIESSKITIIEVDDKAQETSFTMVRRRWL